MSADEQVVYLESGRTLQLATIGHSGQPHLSAMWYALVDRKVCFNTYATSQKARNMDRDPRVTCMIESGDEYATLKGLVIQGRVEIVDDVSKYLVEIARRYPRPGTQQTEQIEQNSDTVNSLPAGRKVYSVIPDSIYSWDHTKLPSGVY